MTPEIRNKLKDVLARPEAREIVLWLLEDQKNTVRSLSLASDSTTIYRLQGRIILLNTLLGFAPRELVEE